MVTQYQLQRIIHKQKRVKVHKWFPKYGGKDYCANLGFMDFINPFGVSGDVTWYINIKNTHIFTFGNKKFQYMSATTKIAAKEN